MPGGGDGPPLKASETIMRNLRVLATDQRTSDEKDEQGNTVVQTFSTVTVEATPKIAEQIAVAQTVGALSLSLRSIADNAAELEQAIASGDLKVPQTDDPKGRKGDDDLARRRATGRCVHRRGRRRCLAVPAPHGARQGRRWRVDSARVDDTDRRSWQLSRCPRRGRAAGRPGPCGSHVATT